MKTDDQFRNEYRSVRNLFVSGADCDPDEFDQLVKNRMGEKDTPKHWINAAHSVKVPCRRCAQTGRFITMVENGNPKGPGGICFRCEGKGYQTEEDARRNWGYDRFGIKVHI